MSAADAPLKKRLNIASSASCFPNLAPGRLDMQSFFSTASIPFLRAENMWRGVSPGSLIIAGVGASVQFPGSCQGASPAMQ